MAKKQVRKDGWKRVEQGIYKRAWADGNGGALLAKITLPGGELKNSSFMPYLKKAEDRLAKEDVVFSAVLR